MKWIAAALFLLAFAACEKKPTAEETEALVEAKKAEEARAAAAQASPAPEKWREGYANPLEKKKAIGGKASPTPKTWREGYENPLEKKPKPSR